MTVRNPPGRVSVASPPPRPAGAWTRLVESPVWRAALLTITLLTAALSVLVIRTADHHRVTLLLLADTTAAVNRHSALEWQAISGGRLDDEVQRAVAHNRARLTDLQSRLGAVERADSRDRSATALHDLLFGRHPAPGPSLADVHRLLGTFLAAVDQEFALLARGELAQAREVDETRVDPSTARLERATDLLRAEREAEARGMLNLALGVAVFTLACSLLTVGAFRHRVRQSRQQAERLERERREEREREERDSLTGLWNRRGLGRLYGTWSATRDLSVLVLDLNRLKVVNDTGGHAAGDAYIKRVALALLDSSRPHELVARWGGDEFVVLLPDLGEAEAHRVAEGTLTRLAAPEDRLPPFAYGVARAPAGTPLERALALADAAMYENKERQRQDLARLGTDPRLGPTAEELSARLEQLETPQEVLQEGLALARGLLEFHASVYLERGGDVFTLRQLDGTLPEALRRQLEGLVYQEGSGLSGRAISGSAAVWSNDYPSEEGALPVWVQTGLKSMIVVPVRYGGQVMGVVGLLHFGSWRVITPQVRGLLEAVARRLGHTHERVQAVEAVKGALQGGLLALGAALEERDLETAGHTERVVKLSERLGRQLGLAGSRLEALGQGASLHDIGKLSVPDAILLKPGALSAEEWRIMRLHPSRGYEIAHRLSGLLATTLDVIRSHHEKWDGSGYPDGLAGEAIPLAARIFAVCDVYDALTHARPYKRAWSHEEALAEIQAQSGRHFDPAVVAAFCEVIGSGAAGGSPAENPADGHRPNR